ncbi:hypothetical protein ACIA5D_51270, partial [Actinoplanes sp. NPDC051513]|uniref:hypothetical protein n=1 Tax=Actinoplanes sp. NPDC051513 TaxID=3363908 RepID=UPI00379ED6B5
SVLSVNVINPSSPPRAGYTCEPLVSPNPDTQGQATTLGQRHERMFWAITNLSGSSVLSVTEIRWLQLSHLIALVRHQGMNAFESVVHTVSGLDAADAGHTALFGIEPYPVPPYEVSLRVSAFESWRIRARGNAWTRTVAYVRGPDRPVALDDIPYVAVPLPTAWRQKS